MKSVRTLLPKNEMAMFRIFLDTIKLHDVVIGDYEYVDKAWYMNRCLCYAYQEKSDEVVAILTHILLKYGNIEKAFREYTNAVMTSSINDPYFNWTP